ncbi:hypothetical protein T07_8962, partial [Trichinella nelsoni]
LQPSNCRTNITSSPELLWSFICSWPRDKSCSHHFVLNLASQTSLDHTVFLCSDVSQLFKFGFIITNSRYTSQHFVLDSNGLRHQKILVAAVATLKLFPMNHGRFKFFIKSSRGSVKYWYVASKYVESKRLLKCVLSEMDCRSKEPGAKL